jgi:hydroxymethylpyrimidine pyrophosphatase-like HAD family hydrolase
MSLIAVAADYDGTLARLGRVDSKTIAALERLKASGRKLVLVSGRQLDDLRIVCEPLNLFDQVVAENGAVLFDPSSREETLLAPPPPEALIAALKARAVEPLSVGRGLLATSAINLPAALSAVRASAARWHAVLNKSSLMLLPEGVDKASGLAAALYALELSPSETLAIGDAENDIAFMTICGLAVAVANALPEVKASAHIVTAGENGEGVVEVVAGLLAEDEAPARA